MSNKRHVMDLVDGDCYKFKNNTLNLSFSTDGIQLVKSPLDKREAWPVLCTILELPPKIRDSKNTAIISGFWLGNKKPTSDILFKSMFTEIDHIKKSGGLNIHINDMNIKINLEIHSFGGDVPAQCLMFDMKYHTGYFSCPFCFIEGIFYLYSYF